MIESYTDGVLIERWTTAGYERFENGQVVDTRPLTAEETWQVSQIKAVNDSHQAERERQAALAVPLTPLPVEGSTVAEIKTSADTAITDLAQQMQVKIDTILGGTT
jgi:hypothetical protein